MVNQERSVLGKGMGIQIIHETLVDEVKGFSLLLSPCLENTIFHRIQQKEQKGDLIQISKMVEDGEMVKIKYLKPIL
jgi:LytS/YehU family sensor histidine kinase